MRTIQTYFRHADKDNYAKFTQPALSSVCPFPTKLYEPSQWHQAALDKLKHAGFLDQAEVGNSSVPGSVIGLAGDGSLSGGEPGFEMLRQLECKTRPIDKQGLPIFLWIEVLVRITATNRTALILIIVHFHIQSICVRCGCVWSCGRRSE
jgi:hypothetical protein